MAINWLSKQFSSVQSCRVVLWWVLVPVAEAIERILKDREGGSSIAPGRVQTYSRQPSSSAAASAFSVVVNVIFFNAAAKRRRQTSGGSINVLIQPLTTAGQA